MCGCPQSADRPVPRLSRYDVRLADIDDKARTWPGDNVIVVDARLWKTASTVDKACLLAHEIAHLEGEWCEPCADERAGSILRGWGIAPEAAEKSFRALIRSRPHASADMLRGYHSADFNYGGARYAGGHLSADNKCGDFAWATNQLNTIPGEAFAGVATVLTWGVGYPFLLWLKAGCRADGLLPNQAASYRMWLVAWRDMPAVAKLPIRATAHSVPYGALVLEVLDQASTNRFLMDMLADVAGDATAPAETADGFGKVRTQLDNVFGPRVVAKPKPPASAPKDDTALGVSAVIGVGIALL